MSPEVRTTSRAGQRQATSSAPPESADDVFFLPGKIDNRRVRQLEELERTTEGRSLFARFMVRGHWRRPEKALVRSAIALDRALLEGTGHGRRHRNCSSAVRRNLTITPPSFGLFAVCFKPCFNLFERGAFSLARFDGSALGLEPSLFLGGELVDGTALAGSIQLLLQGRRHRHRRNLAPVAHSYHPDGDHC